MENATIHICTIYVHTYVHEHAPLAKPGICSGGRISCNPNTGALLSTSINENDDGRSPNYCALLGTRERTGAGMDILALPLAVTFVVQLVINMTMIATIVLIIIIRIRTVKLVSVIVTARVVEMLVVMTMIMIVILIILVAAIVLNLILVTRMKVVIVVLAVLIIVVLRTTIICRNKLNNDTSHNNSNSCSSTTTMLTINTSIRNCGSSNGSQDRALVLIRIFNKSC